MFKLMDKKLFVILGLKYLLNWPYVILTYHGAHLYKIYRNLSPFWYLFYTIPKTKMIHFIDINEL